jgi:hypothetical protein
MVSTTNTGTIRWPADKARLMFRRVDPPAPMELVSNVGSNFGKQINIFAPGAAVPVANNQTTLPLVLLRSGTSFAAPYVSGILAGFLTWDKTIGTTPPNRLFQNAQLGLLNLQNPPTSFTKNVFANTGINLDTTRELPFLGANSGNAVSKRSVDSDIARGVRRQVTGTTTSKLPGHAHALQRLTSSSNIPVQLLPSRNGCR